MNILKIGDVSCDKFDLDVLTCDAWIRKRRKHRSHSDRMDIQVDTEIYGDDSLDKESTRDNELDLLYTCGLQQVSNRAMDDIFETEWVNGEFYDWDNEEHDATIEEYPTFNMTEALASGNAEDLEYIEDMLEYCGLLDDEDDE